MPGVPQGYRVAEQHAGKETRCKACSAVFQIPAAEDQGLDLAELESVTASIPPATQPEPIRPLGRSTAVPPSLTPARKSGGSPARLQRLRALPTWAMILAGVGVVGLLVLLGLLSNMMGAVVTVVLAVLAGALLLAAVVWGVIVGLAQGSKPLVGMLAGAPLIVLIAAIGKLTRKASAQASRGPELPLTTIAMAMGGGVLLMTLIIGFFRNPRAFKRPFQLTVAGVLLALACLVPAFGRSKGSHRYSGPVRPSDSSYQAPAARPTGVRPPSAASPSPTAPPTGPSGAKPPAATTPPGIPGIASPAPTSLRSPSAVARAPEASNNATAPAASSTATAPAVAEKPVTPAPEEKPTAPAEAKDADAVAEVPAGLQLAVGVKIECKWGSSWYAATVVRTDPRGWVLVQYASDGTYEWVEPWRTRPVGSTKDDIGTARPDTTGTWGGNPDVAPPARLPRPKPQPKP